jgi:TRAP-type C4-dicarboxylate transport system permease small subunit
MSQALGLVRRAVQLVIILMFAVLIGTVFYQVLGRYLFNAPPSWSEELARFLQVWIALLASALCIHQSMHLGVDYLLHAVPPRGRAALEVLVHVMVSGFLLLLLVQGVKILDVASVQTSPAMGINMWYAYLAVPVGAALMLLESVLKLGESLRALGRPA